MTGSQARARLRPLLAGMAMLALLAGCDEQAAPVSAGSGVESHGDPNATVLPAEARQAYGEVMRSQVSPEFRNMGRALANDDLATISAEARGLMSALEQLQRQYAARCPVEFVALQKQLRNQLSAVVEFSDGADRTELDRLLGSADQVGAIEKTCADCHARYRGN